MPDEAVDPAAPAPPPPDWTDARHEWLAALWAQSNPTLSASQIGRMMGVTKNAVIGKVRRLGLPPRPSPLLPTSGVVAKRRAVAEARLAAAQSQPRSAPPPAAWATPVAPLVHVPVEAPRAAPLNGTVVQFRPAPPKPPRAPSVAREGCRWVEGDTRGEWRYCDAPRSELGGSWCTEHRLRVFIPKREAG